MAATIERMPGSRAAVVAGGLVFALVLQLNACASFTESNTGDDAGRADGASAEAGDPSNPGDGGAADGTAACPPETCVGRTSCFLWDFASNTCDPWKFEGDLGPTLHECS